jgi:DNA-binding transcriptional LysR family regulator
MYELRQLRTFQAVAARQSVTRAATALGYAQSSVTAQFRHWKMILEFRFSTGSADALN